MAAAEARACWQRTANRCFAQEDTRKAPKISCYSSSSSSKSQCEARPCDEANGSEFPTARYIPLNQNPCPAPDTKWWLHLHPNFAHQRDFMRDQLNSLEAEFDFINAGFADQNGKSNTDYQLSEENSCQLDVKDDAEYLLEQTQKVSAACLKNDLDSKMPELKASMGNSPQNLPKNKVMGELWYPEDHLLNLDPFNCSDSKQPSKLSTDWEAGWMGAEKNEPWWRTADKDELASLVTQKSLEHVENCDLPRPQTKHLRMGPSASLERFGGNGIRMSSSDKKQEMGSPSLTNCMHENSPHGSERPFSDNEYCTTNKAEMQNVSENSPSKAQLLEALCHSQTRAREAEKAAQQAYTEKEHIIKLVFKQASQLFAYKQWFHLLQLENLCLQLRNTNESISNLFPAVLLLSPDKGSQLKKGRCKGAKKRKRDPARYYEISRCAVAFAVGLSLAGAGLLLGWTMGWLFPAF